MTDTQGDIFALLTDDIYTRTQGRARSKEDPDYADRTAEFFPWTPVKK
jgi:hypothetical protein